MKNISLCICLLSFATLCFAGGRDQKSGEKTPPDLSGSWSLDKAKSDVGFGMKAELADVTLVIVQDEHEVKVTKRIKNGGRETTDETVYQIEGGGKTGPGGNRGSQPVSKWSGRKLVTKRAIEINGLTRGGRPVTMETTEEWEISKDGKSLTQTISQTGMPNVSPSSRSKFVFNRVA
jgi:hypothetical protein